MRKFAWVLLALIAGGCGSDEATVPNGQIGMVNGGTGALPTAGANGLPMAGTQAAPMAGNDPNPVGTPMATGGTTPQAGTGGEMEPPSEMMDPPGTGDGPIPDNCRGFSFDDLIYSPGGTVLPNTCAPYDATTNNPFAVRCIDAWPWYQTRFPGDEYCILPPPPDKGIQYGVHPQGKAWFEQVSQGDMSGYDSPSAEFLMDPGDEEERNYETGTDNPAEHNYYRSNVRMRAGSHHMIVSSNDGSMPQEAWRPGSPDGLFGGGLPGAQRPDENMPKSLDKPAEDAGLYRVFPARPGITFNMHHFNSTPDETLKEAWVNLWWEEDATVRIYGIFGMPLSQTFTLSVSPNTTRDLHHSWTMTEPVRLLNAFGHRHAWTSNFSSWIQRAGGDVEVIYQSFDWYDQPTYNYDSATQNPVPSPETLTDGGSSGLLMIEAGDQLHFNCHITYTDERANKVGSTRSPAEIGTLGFANQAFDAEMCILFGSTAKTNIGMPVANTSPVPDFATAD